MKGFVNIAIILAIAALGLSGIALLKPPQQFGADPRILLPIQGGTGTSTNPVDDDILIAGDIDNRYDVKKLTAGSNITIATTSQTVTISSTAGGGEGVPDWQQETFNGDNVLTPTTTIPILVKDTATSTFLGDLITQGLSAIDWIETGLIRATSTGVNVLSGDLHFDGELLPDGSTCANGEILKKTAANDWDCATDNDTGGGTEANVIYTVNGGTTYYTASSTASDNLSWLFQNGFVSQASSTVAAGLTVDGILQASSTALFGSTLELNGVTYTFPSADGSADQVLHTDGSGTLSWAADDTGGAGDYDAWTHAVSGTSATTTEIRLGSGAIMQASSTATAAFNVDGTLSASSTALFTGLMTLYGGLTLETGDTFTFNGDAFTDLTGTGLTISGGALQSSLGTAIDTSEITDDTITFSDIDYSSTLAGNPAFGASEQFFGTTGLLFEGSTADTLEGLLTSADITGTDKTWTLPNTTGTLVTTGDTGTVNTTMILDNTVGLVDVAHTITLAGNPALAASQCFWGASGIICEGTTADAFEALLSVPVTASDKTITFQDATHTVVGRATTDTLTNKTITGASNNISATLLTSGTVPVARVGAAHIDTITEIAAGLKSGADALLITGTAGSDTHCAQWNADGDLVTSGATCGSGAGTYDAWTHAVSGTSATTTEIRFGSGFVSQASSTVDAGLTISGILQASSTILANNIIATGWEGDVIELTTDTTGNYTATIADAGNSTITVTNGTAEGGAVTLDAVDLNCTDCINATEIEDIYLVNNANDTTSGSLTATGFFGSGTATSTLVGGLRADLGLDAKFLEAGWLTATTATSTINDLSIPTGLTLNSGYIVGAGLVDCDAAGDTLNYDLTTGKFSCGSDADTQLTQEQVEDFAGAMVSGNTETLITVTYEDSDGTIDFVVDNDLANYSNATSNFFDTAGTNLNSSGSTVNLDSTILALTGTSTTAGGWRTSSIASNSYVETGALHATGTATSTTVNLSVSTGLDLLSGYLFGAGLADCDADNQTLNWDATTGKFSCGDDDDSGGAGTYDAWSHAESGTSATTTTMYFDGGFVSSASSTVSGDLRINDLFASSTILLDQNLLSEHASLFFLDVQTLTGSSTIYRIKAPVNPFSHASEEATLTLMTDVDGDNTGVNEEFVDIYNERYDDSLTWGMRQIYTGTGVCKPAQFGHWNSVQSKDSGNQLILNCSGTTFVGGELGVAAAASTAAILTAGLHVASSTATYPLIVEDGTPGSDTSPFVIDASGWVGIGEKDPSSALHFKGSSSDTTFANHPTAISWWLQNTDSTDNNWINLLFRASDDTVTSGITVQTYNQASHFASINFETRGASGYLRAGTFYDGNLGLGVTTPSSKLEVSGNVDMVADGNRIDFDTDNDTSIRASADDQFDFEQLGVDRTVWSTSAYRFNDTTLDMDLIWDGDTVTDLLFGNAGTDRIGIATTTPTTIFSVHGTSTVKGLVVDSDDAGIATSTISIGNVGDSKAGCIEMNAQDDTVIGIYINAAKTGFEFDANGCSND